MKAKNRKDVYIMAGYNGFSMSNNAVAAYKDGEKPLSKWTKKEIIYAIKKEIREKRLKLTCSYETLEKMPVDILKNLCLSYSSWHHTSNHYNKTDFYSIDIDRIADLTNEMLEEEIVQKKKRKLIKKSEEKWRCAFLEWTGTRRYPIAKEKIEEGIVRGNWFYRENGSKKKITANGFRFIEKI